MSERRGRALDVWDTGNDRDQAAADARRRAAMLRDLQFAGARPAGDDAVRALIHELWLVPEPNRDQLNDLGCALALVHEWTQAVETLETAAAGGNASQKRRAEANRALVESVQP